MAIESKKMREEPGLALRPQSRSDIKERKAAGGQDKGGSSERDYARENALTPAATENLGLGGFRSLFGSRGPAPNTARGNAMIDATMTDNALGYFDPVTREYVPWYSDALNRGGINGAGNSGDVSRLPGIFGLISQLAYGKDPASDNGYRSSAKDWQDYTQPSAQGQSPVQSRPNYGDHSANYGGGGGTVVPLSDLTGAPTYSPREWYDYPTEFPLGAEPESLLSLERPFGSRVVPSTTAGPSSQLSDRAIQRDMPAYPAQAEFPLGAEPEFLQSLERPIRPYAGRGNFMEFSQPSDRAIQRDMPAYPAQVDGVVGTDTMMGRQVNPIPQVDAAEFQRFRSKFENLLKLNRQWGFPDREAAVFQALKAGGSNY